MSNACLALYMQSQLLFMMVLIIGERLSKSLNAATCIGRLLKGLLLRPEELESMH